MTASNKRGASDLSVSAYAADETLNDADAVAATATALGLPLDAQQQQELTSTTTNASTTSGSSTVPATTASLADISDGAKRLAQELDQYIVAKGPKNTSATVDVGLSDDAVADLQLATARKLREVCKKKRVSAIRTVMTTILAGFSPVDDGTLETRKLATSTA